MIWTKFGEGNYNTAYKNSQDTLVLKIPKKNNKTDLPKRSVRLWNEINPHLSPPAYILKTELGEGWVCPYIVGRIAQDHEIMPALLDIFKRTGRIIVDATSPKNFITTHDAQVICVDIGMALELEQREQNSLFTAQRMRRMSITSLFEWSRKRTDYTTFFAKSSRFYPQTIDTIKALLFIKINRPDIYDADFLQDSPRLLAKLAAAYDAQLFEQAQDSKKPTQDQSSANIATSLETLLEIRATTLKNMKDSCLNELRRYIHSRGSLNAHDEFQPSLITRLFRNTELTEYKISDAVRLIKTIQQAHSPEQIHRVLSNITGKTLLFASNYSSGYAFAIQRCLLIVSTLAKHYNVDCIAEQRGYQL